jgi:DNA-binding NarL/FixJ family response regulator
VEESSSGRVVVGHPRAVTASTAPARSSSTLTQLTERESEVLTLVAQGMSNTEIANRLYISLFTAKTHVSRILTKLNARDRAQLVMHAYETGLVTPGN